MFDNILFDFDGTVLDTGAGIMHSVQIALKKHGIEAEAASLRSFVGPPLMDSFIREYHMDEEEAMQAVRDYREYYRPTGIYECSLYPGFIDLLHDLKAAGKKLGIATSKPLDMALTLLKKEDILDCFDVTFGTSGKEKDNLTKAQIIQLAINELEADDNNVVMVGDTKYDILGAHACGIKAIGVRYGYSGPGELEAAGSDWIAEDVAGLRSLLLG